MSARKKRSLVVSDGRHFFLVLDVHTWTRACESETLTIDDQMQILWDRLSIVHTCIAVSVPQSPASDQEMLMLSVFQIEIAWIQIACSSQSLFPLRPHSF